MRPDLSDEVNRLRYARLLFFVGLFNQGLQQLQAADYLIETAMLALTLRDLNLIVTTHDFLTILGEQTIARTNLTNQFSSA